MMKKILNEWRKFLLSENVQKTDYVKGGKIKLYHYTTSWRLYTAESFIMDPMFFVKSRGTYSRNEWNASGVPRSFFYTDLDRTETFIGGRLYTAEVDADKIYDLKNDEKDPEGKSKHYWRRFGNNWDAILKEIIKDGYDGVYYTINQGSIPVIAYFKKIKVDFVPKEQR
tara:strand:+ start:1382 stop:1888 length:507 start_codon:yes stop_codon:yes gene_type:complete